MRVSRAKRHHSALRFAAMTAAEKMQAQRVRRKAARQCLRLSKSRRRDPDAVDYGRWTLTRNPTGEVVASGALADIERYLSRRR